MGAKAKYPNGARRKKRASKRAANASAEERHRYYPDSIPPGMAAEVFDVSRIDEDGLEVLDDDEVKQEAPPPPSLRPASLRPPPAPHPPRPSTRAPIVPSRPPPPPQRSLMPRPLGPDDLHRDTPLSYARNPAPLLVERAPDASVAPQGASGPRRVLGLVAAVALVALLAGLVLGRRGDARSPSSTIEARHATAPGLEGARSHEPFSSARAAAAIDSAVARAQACRVPSAPNGPLVVRLTFAQTGQAVGVDVRGPLAGTAAGDCFAAALREVRVPSFEGGIASVDRTVEAP